MDAILRSLRFALRINGKHPLSSIIIVSAIAVLVAIVGVFYATLKQQRVMRVPFEDPARMLRFWTTDERGSSDRFSKAVYLQWMEQQQSFAKLGGLQSAGKQLMSDGSEPVSLRMVACTADVLEMTGLSPIIGRFIAESDERVEDGRVLVLSEEVWRGRFEASDRVIGQTVMLDEEAFTVIGVAPRSLTNTRLAYGVDAWTALYFNPLPSGQRSVEMVGRLKNGVTRGQAQEEVESLLGRIVATNEAAEASSIAKRTFAAALDDQIRQRDINWQELAAITAMTTLLLCVALIACFNMTTLLVVRTASRIGEINVRISQGASRGRIIRQLLGESLLLSVAGGGFGLLLSLALLRLIPSEVSGFTFDLTMYAIAFGIAVSLGAAVSIWPALRASRANFMAGMKDLGGVSTGRQGHRVRNFLVGAQVCMAAILISTATLNVRGLMGMLAGELPVDAEHLLAVEVQPSEELFPSGGDRSNYARQALSAIRELPGVRAAAVTSTDLNANYTLLERIGLPDSDTVAPKERLAVVHQVSGELPTIVGRRLLVGRDLKTDGPPTLEAVVSQTFVKQYLNGGEALGTRLQCSRVETGDLTIVGVVSDSHVRMSPSRLRPEVFINYRHPLPTRSSVTLLVDVEGSVGQMASILRKTLLDLNPRQPVGRAISVDAIIDSWLKPMREVTVATVSLAVFGLMMAVLGVYGVVAYSSVERTQEMGIRMALGAGRRAVAKLIIGEGVRLLAFGAVPGVFVAVIVAQGLPSGMFRTVSSLDPTNYLSGLVVIGLTGFAASLFPALRMVKLKPMEALRFD